MTKQREIIESVANNGDTQYSVITINPLTGRWLWKEDFKTKAEAEKWIKHTC